MQIMHVQGNDLKPYSVDDFQIAPGETVDVLVKINNDNPTLIYAEALDTVGAAVGALVTAENQTVDFSHVEHFPEPLPVTREMMSFMMGDMDHSMMSDHNMAMNMDMNKSMNMEMPTEASITTDSISHEIPETMTSAGTKYEPMRAAIKTNDPNIPIAGVINMELFGYMERFIWFINGVPEYQAKPIVLEPGKRYRMIFTNNSMMRHPMHMHGHWFILRNGNDEYDPLLHTIEVPPGATMVADIDTDASGQWFFHCHLLYHMFTGMSRVFQYSSMIEITQQNALPQNIEENTEFHNRPIVRVDAAYPIDKDLIQHPQGHAMGMWKANYIDAGFDPFRNIQKLSYKGLFGSDYHKLQLFTNDAELNKGSLQAADLDIFYWHPISQFWTVKGGANYVYRPANNPFWQPGIGIEGLMPYFIDTDLRAYYHSGNAKLDTDFSRDTQITNQFFLKTSVRGILSTDDGLEEMRFIARPFYKIMPGLDVFVEYEFERDITLSHNQNTLTLGLSWM
jgi:hypothetical protein